MTASIDDAANKHFDYIIVGAGAAGLTIAASLTEDTRTSVLVLEAGGTNLNDPAILRPASYASHFGNDSYAWSHHTTEQKYGNNKVHAWHRGKGLGGSTAINFMVWTKPPKEEIDDFERLGNAGWNWDNYQKYVEKVEGFTEPSGEVQDKFKLKINTFKLGRQGPIKITYPGLMHEAEIEVQQTLINAGFPIAPHPLSGNPRGVFFTPNTYDPVTYTRSYATTAYYLPNRDRPNFNVLVGAHVNRVVTTKSKDDEVRATGVEFTHGGKQYIVHAQKEVILSASTFHSPQILELSGIGRRNVLDKIGVPVQVELPGVGENVQEHTMLGITWEVKESVKYDTLELLRDPDVLAKNLELHTKGTGLFTMGLTGFSFVPPEVFSPNADVLYKKAQETYAAVDGKANPGLAEQYKIQMRRLEPGNSAPGSEFIITPGMLSYPNPPEPGKRYVTIVTALNHTWSRGTVHCTSNDPLEDPELDPHYFEQEIDLDLFVEGAKFTRGLADVAPLKNMIVKEVNPGPNVQTDEELKNWIKDSFTTTWHTASSCSMLPKEMGGVVDNNLKVYGTSNLRVIDLSVVPLHFAAHALSTVYAMATQASEIIKGNFRA